MKEESRLDQGTNWVGLGLELQLELGQEKGRYRMRYRRSEKDTNSTKQH